MATPEEVKKQIEDLATRVDGVNRKKAELQALLQVRKTELANIIKAIDAAGLDPRSLAADEGKAEVEALIAASERDLVTTEQAVRGPAARRERQPSDSGKLGLPDLAAITTPEWRHDFLRFVRGVAESRRVVLGNLRAALERGDEPEALRLARQIVGLDDAGAPSPSSV